MKKCRKNSKVIDFSLILMVYLVSSSIYGELAQLARAPALHAGGQEFESPILHQFDSLALIL